MFIQHSFLYPVHSLSFISIPFTTSSSQKVLVNLSDSNSVTSFRFSHGSLSYPWSYLNYYFFCSLVVVLFIFDTKSYSVFLDGLKLTAMFALVSNHWDYGMFSAHEVLISLSSSRLWLSHCLSHTVNLITTQNFNTSEIPDSIFYPHSMRSHFSSLLLLTHILGPGCPCPPSCYPKAVPHVTYPLCC